MSLCDGSWDLIRSYGVRLPPNASGITNPVFRHWCQQEPVSQLSHRVVGVLLSLICVVSVLGNLLVVVVFNRYRRLRSPANVLIVNLAASDLLNGLLHPMAAYSAFEGRWSFGKEGCEAYAALCGLFGLASIVTLTAIAVERCLVISMKPWHASGILFTRSMAKVAIALVWLYCAALVLPPLALGWGAFVPEGFLTSCSFDYLSRTPRNRAYFFFLFAFGFFLPIVIIGICYIFILQTIFQNERALKRNNVTKSNPSKVKRSEYRAAEMILMVVGLFLASWTPYSLIACLGQFGDKSLITPWVSVLPSIFAKMSTLYNPAVYGLSHRHFRAALRRMFQRDSRRSRSGTYLSRNSSLRESRNGCPCLPLTCHSDVLEDNSSSLTGKRIFVGCPQEDCQGISLQCPAENCRGMSDGGSRVKELCVCGRAKLVSRDFVSSSRLRCDLPNSSMNKYPFCRRSLMKTHVPKVKSKHRQEIHECTSPANSCTDQPSIANSLHEYSFCRHILMKPLKPKAKYKHKLKIHECTSPENSCVDMPSIANSMYKYPFCTHSLVKLHVPEAHSEHKLDVREYTSPENSFSDHNDVTSRGKRNDFANSFIHRPIHHKVTRRRRGSVESGLFHNEPGHHSDTPCPSSGSMHEFCNSLHGYSVLCLKQDGELKNERAVPRGSDDLQWPSMRFSANKEPSYEFCWYGRSSRKRKKMKSEVESGAILKQDNCYKTIVVKVEPESDIKLPRLPQHILESIPNQNSKSVEVIHEELPTCLRCISSSFGDGMASLPPHILESINQNSKSVEVIHEDLQTCVRCISSSFGDGMASNSQKNEGGVHPSLFRSLMFRSERSIHQKYQMIFESDRIVREPMGGCFHSEFFGNAPFSNNQRAAL